MSQYGNRSTGWLFYKNQPFYFVEASHEVYFEQKLIESYLCNLQHCFMSFEGQAESYNDLWWNTHKVNIIQKFISMNPAVGKHFDREIVNREEEDDDGVDEVKRGTFSGMQSMHCKSVSKVAMK